MYWDFVFVEQNGLGINIVVSIAHDINICKTETMHR